LKVPLHTFILAYKDRKNTSTAKIAKYPGGAWYFCGAYEQK